MIREIEGFSRYIAIAGFRNVKIGDVDDLLETVRQRIKEACIQFFDAKVIAGWEHLFFATLNALRVFENKMNISNSLTIEILLFASGQRQIRKALELLGIKPSSPLVAVIILDETKNMTAKALEIVSRIIPGERDDSVLELTDEKIDTIRELFDISNLELRSKSKKEGFERQDLIDLVIEHIALVATQR